MVSNLLKCGADPNIEDNFQYTPLSLALNLNYLSLSKLILKFENQINFKNVQNSKLLLYSIEKLDVDLTQQLLKKGCDPNLAVDQKTGETCLHMLIYKMCYARSEDEQEKCDAVLSLLIQGGINVEA